jgi:hypothetical protein
MFKPKPSQPPPPDTTATLRVGDQRTVETLFSPKKKFRVTITQDQAGNYRIHSDRWCIEDWDVAGKAFWIQVDRGSSMTDTLGNARQLANEHLVLFQE